MPFNSRKMRHHRPIQLEILYYPQQVKRKSGATGTIPYSHYWHYDHEENHDVSPSRAPFYYKINILQ